MKKTQAAFLLSVRQLVRHHSRCPDQLYLWTFTLPKVLSIGEAKDRWNHLLTLLRNYAPKMRGLRVFELHDAHGLHVHLLCNCWLNVYYVRLLAQQSGWGRIHAKQIPVSAAGWYLSKRFFRRERCLKGWRLWDGFGEWSWTRVKDVVVDTPFTRIYRACREWLGWKSNHDFFHRMRIVRCLLVRSIVEGWTDGLGPRDRPYSCFNFYELIGFIRKPGVLA